MGFEDLNEGMAAGALLFRHNPDLVVVLRKAPEGDLHVVLANDALLEATGWRPEEVEGRLSSELVAPEVLEAVVANCDELHEVGDTVRFEIAAEVPAGRRVYDMTIVALPSVDGVPHYLQVTHDVTEVHRDRRALEETQALARIGHWTWDLTTNDLYCTNQVTDIYGLPPTDGPEDVELFWGQVLPDDEPPLRLLIGDAIEVGGAFEAEYRVRGWTDVPRIVHTRGKCVVASDGAVLRIAGTVQDVTEERETERLARRAELHRERQAHALELNDDVLQGLATVRLALMTGSPDEALRLLDRTSEAARGLVGELLSATSGDRIVAGDLVRERPPTADRLGS